jgi:hypothetical protein
MQTAMSDGDDLLHRAGRELLQLLPGAHQLPQELSSWVVGQGFSPWTVLTLILLFYLASAA